MTGVFSSHTHEQDHWLKLHIYEAQIGRATGEMKLDHYTQGEREIGEGTRLVGLFEN